VEREISPVAEWQQVDHGPRFKIPSDWVKVGESGIDSNGGGYSGDAMHLNFDEVFGLGFGQDDARKALAKLKEKRRNQRSLAPNEEIWKLGGRLAEFSLEKPSKDGSARFGNKARLYIPYEEVPGYLVIIIEYRDASNLETVREIFRSVRRPRIVLRK
jgi:hypothetical protein